MHGRVQHGRAVPGRALHDGVAPVVRGHLAGARRPAAGCRAVARQVVVPAAVARQGGLTAVARRARGLADLPAAVGPLAAGSRAVVGAVAALPPAGARGVRPAAAARGGARRRAVRVRAAEVHVAQPAIVRPAGPRAAAVARRGNRGARCVRAALDRALDAAGLGAVHLTAAGRISAGRSAARRREPGGATTLLGAASQRAAFRAGRPSPAAEDRFATRANRAGRAVRLGRHRPGAAAMVMAPNVVRAAPGRAQRAGPATDGRARVRVPAAGRLGQADAIPGAAAEVRQLAAPHPGGPHPVRPAVRAATTLASPGRTDPAARATAGPVAPAATGGDLPAVARAQPARGPAATGADLPAVARLATRDGRDGAAPQAARRRARGATTVTGGPGQAEAPAMGPGPSGVRVADGRRTAGRKDGGRDQAGHVTVPSPAWTFRPGSQPTSWTLRLARNSERCPETWPTR